MANKSKSSFVGSYVKDIELALIASAVSGKHALLIGAPGWGKTAIARSMAIQIAPENEWTFTRFATSTPPEQVTGPIEISAVMDVDNPRVEYNVEGTPYDPRARLSIFDEVFRPSDVIFDILLDLLDRQDIELDTAPTIWGTSNFIVKSERTEALRDRFALWVWVVPDEIDIPQIIDVHMKREYNQRIEMVNGRSIPSIADIDDIRKSKPGDKAIGAVSGYLEVLSAESAKGGYPINPRRLEQWSAIVYRTSVYLLDGETNFSTVPPDIGKVMKYAYPCFDKESWIKWQEIASSVSDPVGTAIETVTNAAYDKFRSVHSRGASKFEMAEELGKVLSSAERDLRKLVKGKDDDRVEQSLSELTNCFGALCRGENPFS